VRRSIARGDGATLRAPVPIPGVRDWGHGPRVVEHELNALKAHKPTPLQRDQFGYPKLPVM